MTENALRSIIAALATAIVVAASTAATAAFQEDPATGRFGPVTVVAKKPWQTANQRGFVVSYKVDGKTHKGAKVYCANATRAVYLIEGLDRGDGRKMDIDVGAEGGAGLAEDLAPRYMNWAIDLWAQTCR